MKNIYLETQDKKECNGCGICAIECPQNAIKLVEDSEGFYYPKIDEKKCIHCNKCKNICSNANDSNQNGKAYMAINKNKTDLERSASGGMFYILAKYVIENDGVVFGVEYGENLKVQHNYYENLEMCKKFQGSKYLRSDLGNSYQKVKEFLEQNRYVLFTGTPCQCNALKVYLKKEYNKLIICDIICHANPSQKVFDKYKKEIEDIAKKKITSIRFRSKENGWKNSMPIIYFEDKTKIEDDLFYRAFVEELFNRPSCHACKFSSSNRISDFTIGDFWGIDKVLPEIVDRDTGISLLLVNSLKAETIFDKISNDMEYIEVDRNEAFKYNHNSNLPMNKNREKFFYDFEKKPILKNIKRNLYKTSFFKRVFRKLKSLLY